MTGRGTRREQGFALVVVLCVMAILALVVGSVIATGRTEVRLAHSRRDIAALQAIADGALNITILRMLNTSAALQPPADATPFTVPFAGYDVRVTVQDESGKIDLNMAGEELLRLLFLSVGSNLETAQTLTDRILDWREPGLGKRLNGAKADDYRAAGFAYGPRNGPFESLEELKLVMGMTPQLFDAVAPALTIYSQTAGVDPTLASVGVLQVLRGIGDSGFVASMLTARMDQESKPIVPLKPIVRLGHAFTLTAEVSGVGRLRLKRSAVVRLTGHPGSPLWIYRWD